MFLFNAGAQKEKKGSEEAGTRGKERPAPPKPDLGSQVSDKVNPSIHQDLTSTIENALTKNLGTQTSTGTKKDVKIELQGSGEERTLKIRAPKGTDATTIIDALRDHDLSEGIQDGHHLISSKDSLAATPTEDKDGILYSIPVLVAKKHTLADLFSEKNENVFISGQQYTGEEAKRLNRIMLERVVKTGRAEEILQTLNSKTIPQLDEMMGDQISTIGFLAYKLAIDYEVERKGGSEDYANKLITKDFKGPSDSTVARMQELNKTINQQSSSTDSTTARMQEPNKPVNQQSSSKELSERFRAAANTRCDCELDAEAAIRTYEEALGRPATDSEKNSITLAIGSKKNGESVDEFNRAVEAENAGQPGFKEVSTAASNGAKILFNDAWFSATVSNILSSSKSKKRRSGSRSSFEEHRLAMLAEETEVRKNVLRWLTTLLTAVLFPLATADSAAYLGMKAKQSDESAINATKKERERAEKIALLQAASVDDPYLKFHSELMKIKGKQGGELG